MIYLKPVYKMLLVKIGLPLALMAFEYLRTLVSEEIEKQSYKKRRYSGKKRKGLIHS